MNSLLSPLPSVKRLLENPIGWCDATANIVTGCDKVSEGCKNCYAQAGTRARVLRAQGIETWGTVGVRHPVEVFETKVRRLNKLCICDKCHRTYPAERLKPFQVHRGGDQQIYCCGDCKLPTLRRIRLFADSNSDWLDPKWLIPSRADMLGEMLKTVFECDNVDFLFLTKRPRNFRSRLIQVIGLYRTASCNDAFVSRLESWLGADYVTARSLGGDFIAEEVVAPSNIWSGVSIENQYTANERIPDLLKIPAHVRFVSAEPLLAPINLGQASPHGYYCDDFIGCVDHQFINPQINPDGNMSINWVIVGGESGPHRRDCGVGAIENIARQCQASGVPVYVKQDCAHKPGQQGRLCDEIWSLKQFPFA